MRNYSARQDGTGGKWFALVSGQLLVDKHGWNRRFDSEPAARRAAMRQSYQSKRRREMTKTWRGYKAGDRIIMDIQTMGATCDDVEVVYSTGSHAVIDSVDYFGPVQGHGVTVTIGESDRAIVNSFDDRDVAELTDVPFRHAAA